MKIKLCLTVSTYMYSDFFYLLTSLSFAVWKKSAASNCTGRLSLIAASTFKDKN